MSFKKTREIMAVRRASAEKRQAEYDKLTLEQKLAKLPPEPAGAKVRAKLMKQLEASKKPAKEEKKVEDSASTPPEVRKQSKQSKKSKKESK